MYVILSKAARCSVLLLSCYCTSGIGQKPKRSDFSDLLGSNFSSSANTGPKTLKDMRADSDINNSLDPDRAKVCVCVCVLFAYMLSTCFYMYTLQVPINQMLIGKLLANGKRLLTLGKKNWEIFGGRSFRRLSFHVKN